MSKAILTLLSIAIYTASAQAGVQCRVAYPPNTPVPKSQSVCLNNGETEHLKFDKNVDIDSIRMLRTDGALGCSELDSDLGIFMFDKSKSNLVIGPALPNGCYLILWNEA